MYFRSSVTVVVMIGLAIAGWASIAHADDPIASLNRSIQERFKDVDKYFGLRRIVVIGDTPHQFRPESVVELSAVQELKDARMRVALYLAGRSVLNQEPDLTTKEPTVINRRVIFGPVSVTDRGSEVGLPAAFDLIEESRMAFRTLIKSERYDFVVADWKFTARAVRATTTQCLSCHRGRSMGDPLGVVLYAHQPRE